MVWIPTGSDTPRAAPTAWIIVARPVTPPGGKTVGNQKQVGRDGGQGTPQHDLGQVVKEVHRKNALDVQTICHAASLKKAQPNGCALNFLLYSILPIRRTKTTPAQGLFWIQTRPTVRLGIGLKPPDVLDLRAFCISVAGSPTVIANHQTGSRSPSSRTASTLLVSTPVRRSLTIWYG